MVMVVSLVIAIEIGMVLMVLLYVVVVQMVVVVGNVVMLLVVVVAAKWGEWGIAEEFKGGAAVADDVWKSWVVNDSSVDASAAYGCASDFDRGKRTACGGKR